MEENLRRLVVRCLDGGDLCFFLRQALSDEGIVLCFLLFLVLNTATLDGAKMATALETHGGNETLDLGCFSIGFSVLLLLALDFSPDNVFPHIILFAKVEEPPDLGGPLGAKALGEYIVGEPGDVVVTLLDDDEREDSDVGTDDAATDRLALALTGTARTIA